LLIHAEGEKVVSEIIAPITNVIMARGGWGGGHILLYSIYTHHIHTQGNCIV